MGNYMKPEAAKQQKKIGGYDAKHEELVAQLGPNEILVAWGDNGLYQVAIDVTDKSEFDFAMSQGFFTRFYAVSRYTFQANQVGQ